MELINFEDKAQEEATRLGAKLLHITQVRDAEYVVLCKWRGEYVTWKFGGLGFYWGHYFSCFLHATDDFKTRVAAHA